MEMWLIKVPLVVLALAILYSIVKPFTGLGRQVKYKGYSTTKKRGPNFIKEAQKERDKKKAHMDERKILLAKHGSHSKAALVITKRNRANELKSRVKVKKFK
ncbi:hypothetical protein KAR91_51545 [Candidatus Pacearchaeota archaeon]|nr:hypothetical protein [Candidatus Pacearchaeota archaeon]